MKRILAASFALAGLLAISGAARAAVSTGMDFELKLQHDHFYLTVHQYYPPGVSLDQARSILLNSDLLVQVSDLVTHEDQIPNMAGGFELKTTATKYHISLTSVNDCTLTTSQFGWQRSCSLDPSNSTNRRLFVGGRGTNSTGCVLDQSQKTARVVCTISGEAAPKKIHYYIYNRSPQQLSAGGAEATIHDLGALFTYATSRISAKDAKELYENSPLANAASRMADEAPDEADPDRLGDQTLVIRGSSDGRYSSEVRSSL